MRTILIIAFVLVMMACDRRTYDIIYPTLSDGLYDSEFPYKNCSKQLDEIAGAVRKIYCLTDYKTFIFKDEEQLLPRDVGGRTVENLLDLTSNVSNTFEAANGSGTVIHYDGERIALITCSHIIDFPDTIYTYLDDNNPLTLDHLYSMSVKFRQRIFFMGLPEGEDLEVLAIDEEKDLALIGREVEGFSQKITVFDYPLGKSGDLEWGTFVYVMGYPLGFQMITRGIVSKPTGPRDDYFLIDASFNEGFSGGIILAIKDGVPNFELVGIGRSASASFENVLVPEKKDYEMIYNPDIPYEGSTYVELRKNLNYGITRAISSEAIRRFYVKNRKSLEEKGYDLSHFFKEAQ